MKENMFKLHTLVVILLALAIPAGAQTYIGGAVSVTRSSAFDPSPLATGDGGQTFAGAYVEAGYQFPRGFNARVLAEYLAEPTLTNIFTQDEGSDRRARDEFRLRPELRYTFGSGSIRPFVGSGVDYYRQRFTALEDGKQGYSSPAAGLNPYLTAGARVGYSHEANYTRLFTDSTALNGSYLSGHRIGYTYTRGAFGRFDLKVAGEIDYLRYRESNGRTTDLYYERDAVFKLRVGLTYGRGRR